jgi:hypothetical protein
MQNLITQSAPEGSTDE